MSEGGVDKALLALLNGLSKREYFHEVEITDEFLRTEVMGDMADEGARLLKYTHVLHSAISSAGSIVGVRHIDITLALPYVIDHNLESR